MIEYPTPRGEDGVSADLPSELDLARLLAVSTSTLAGCLQRRGIRNAFMSGLVPLRTPSRLVGRARTLRYLPARDDLTTRYGGERSAQRSAVEAILPGEVLVISARGVHDAGTIGDLYAMRVAARGGAGVVTDGAVRDRDALSQVEIPIYAAASHGATLMRAHLAVDTQLPIACGEVTVLPGDLIVGDADGVLCVPAAVAAEVAAQAAQQELEEEFAAEKIRSGSSCEGWFPLADRNRPEFDRWAQARSNEAAGS